MKCDTGRERLRKDRMFERYTEKARRVIFFARYEASQLGSPCIETEHLLLGLLREDKALTNRFLRSHASVESIRKQIEENTVVRERVSTSVDLPLSNECKRILAYGSEEAERLGHKHIGTEHLLLGILREEGSFAAAILSERGIGLDEVRNELAREPHMPLSEKVRAARSSESLSRLIERLIDLNDRSPELRDRLVDRLLRLKNEEIAGIHARLDEVEPPETEVPAMQSPTGAEARGYVTASVTGPRIDLYKIQSATPLKVKLLRGLWHCFQPPFFKHTPRMLSPLRILLLRLFGAKIGPACHIGAGVKVWVPWNLKMGRRSSIGFDCEIYNFAPVEIGDQVVVSQRAYLCSSTHNYTHPHFPLVSSPILIHSQAWIAAEAFIAPGVTVGEGAVIGACSVVTRSMPPWQVCAGNPCRAIKTREVKPAE